MFGSETINAFSYIFVSTVHTYKVQINVSQYTDTGHGINKGYSHTPKIRYTMVSVLKQKFYTLFLSLFYRSCAFIASSLYVFQ